MSGAPSYHARTHMPGGTDPIPGGGHGPWIELELLNGFTGGPLEYRHAPGSPGDDSWELEWRGHVEGPTGTFCGQLPTDDRPPSDKYGEMAGEDSDTGDPINVLYYIEAATGYVFIDYPIGGTGSGGSGTPGEARGCQVYLSSDITIVDGFVQNTVDWDSETEGFDTDGFHDTGTNPSRVTIPTGLAGKYLAIAQYNVTTSNSGDYAIVIRKTLSGGGTDSPFVEQQLGANGNYHGTIAVAGIFDMAEGDYLQVLVAQKTGANRTIDHTATHFSVMKLDVGSEGAGGIQNLADLTDVTGGPPATGEAPVWDGDSFELTNIATQAELDAHVNDTSDAHDASAISIVDTGAYFTGTDVEAALQELGAGGGGGGAPTGAQYVTLATDGTLSAERVLTAGTGVTVTDAGAGSTVTVAAAGGVPWLVQIVPFGAYSVVAGSWTRNADNSVLMGGYLYNGDNVNPNDEVTWPITLSAGTWTIELIHHKASVRGIYTFSLDGSSVGTIDGYNATGQLNQVGTITGISVSASGMKTLSVKSTTKNASSTKYGMILTLISLVRTA